MRPALRTILAIFNAGNGERRQVALRFLMTGTGMGFELHIFAVLP